jgi:hypothetical protein
VVYTIPEIRTFSAPNLKTLAPADSRKHVERRGFAPIVSSVAHLRRFENQSCPTTYTTPVSDRAHPHLQTLFL